MALSEAEELELLELEEAESAAAPKESAPKVAEPTSNFDALVSGTGQALGGFGDEIVGGIGAGVNAIAGSDKRPFIDVYREHRDRQRAKDKQAAAEHPAIYGAAKYIPQMAVAATTGGMGNVALAGLQGLGESEADLTKGEFGDAALDTAKSATVQAVVGGIGKGLSAGTKAFANSAWPTQVSEAAGKLKGLTGGVVAEIPHNVENVRKSLSWIVQNAPERLGKFGGMLRQAMQRGASAFATTNFILQQKNPEYQQILKEQDTQ